MESSGLLADSTDLLKEAYFSLEVLTPSSFSAERPELWCVENPLLRFDASRLRRKFDSGASRVITQPPLLQHSFLKWFEQCDRTLFGDGTREETDPFVIGIPCITSTNSLSFWFEICGVNVQQNREALGALKDLKDKEDSLSRNGVGECTHSD